MSNTFEVFDANGNFVGRVVNGALNTKYGGEVFDGAGAKLGSVDYASGSFTPFGGMVDPGETLFLLLLAAIFLVAVLAVFVSPFVLIVLVAIAIKQRERLLALGFMAACLVMISLISAIPLYSMVDDWNMLYRHGYINLTPFEVNHWVINLVIVYLVTLYGGLALTAILLPGILKLQEKFSKLLYFIYVPFGLGLTCGSLASIKIVEYSLVRWFYINGYCEATAKGLLALFSPLFC